MIFLKKRKLSRRTMLRGMAAGGVAAGAGLTLALPPLDIMFDDHGEAHADGTGIPCRYGTFFWGNGVRPDRFRPGAEGAEWWRSPNEALRSIADSTTIRDLVSILGNFEYPADGTAHHTGRAQAITSTYDPNRGTYGNPTGPSIDFVLADHLEGQTPIRSIDLGISEQGKATSTSRGAMSVDNGGNFTSAEYSPRALFDRLFGMGVEAPETSGDLSVVRQSMVDVIREDAARLRPRLGTVDQQRLDTHLDGLRGIERAIEGFETSLCDIPASSSTDYSADRGHELLVEKNAVMADMVAMAFACDLTRVMTYQFTSMQSDCLFWQVGAEQGSHVLTHDDRGTDNPLDPQYEMVHRVATFVMENFARLLEALAAVPEGDGNVLYNSAILGLSEVNDGTRHTYTDVPLILAGRAGGRFIPGAYHREPSGRTIGDLHYTILRTLGVEIDSFGTGPTRGASLVDGILV